MPLELEFRTKDNASFGTLDHVHAVIRAELPDVTFFKDPVTHIHIDVRGTGNALAPVARIAQAAGWQAIFLATGQPVTDDNWTEFQDWRDSAISEIKNEQSSGPNG